MFSNCLNIDNFQWKDKKFKSQNLHPLFNSYHKLKKSLYCIPSLSHKQNSQTKNQQFHILKDYLFIYAYLYTNKYAHAHYLFVSSPKKSGDPPKVLEPPKISIVVLCPSDFRWGLGVVTTTQGPTQASDSKQTCLQAYCGFFWVFVFFFFLVCCWFYKNNFKSLIHRPAPM